MSFPINTFAVTVVDAAPAPAAVVNRVSAVVIDAAPSPAAVADFAPAPVAVVDATPPPATVVNKYSAVVVVPAAAAHSCAISAPLLPLMDLYGFVSGSEMRSSKEWAVNKARQKRGGKKK